MMRTHPLRAKNVQYLVRYLTLDQSVGLVDNKDFNTREKPL